MLNEVEIIKSKTLFISLIMLCLVMLSIGATFANDDVADVIATDDEMAVDEALSVEEDTPIVSVNESTATSSIIINNTNLKEYVDESGGINENITAEELIFEGTFEDLNLSVEHPYKITGYNATLINPNILILSSNVTFSGFTINQTKRPNSIFIAGFEENIVSDVTVSDVTIDFVDNTGGADAIAIDVVNTDNFSLFNSIINYVGNTNAYYTNNAVLISNSNRTIISNNKFKLSLVSAAVGWAEVPAGSGIWVSSPMSEGIVVKDSNWATLEGNEIDVTYNNVSGSYDTLYAVDFKNSNDAIIANNAINSNGNTYIYGIIISGDDFIIRSNNITTVSDYYANGIDIEGPASGVVEYNLIDVKANNSAYAIYSGMNGADVKANYTNNTISGEAYNIFGLSLGDVESNIVANEIIIDGNYTTGIAYFGSIINMADNQIVLISSEVGNESIWESFGVEAVGVKVIKGNATLTNNVISTSGKGVSLSGNLTNAELEGNFINVVGKNDKDAYAIYAVDASKVHMFNNTIDYQGTTQGTGINNAVYLNNVTESLINSNKFDLDLVSSYVPWAEVPAGSGNWVSSPISEGIVVANSDGVIFDSNTVNVDYTDIVGSYDTIYAVDFKNSGNAIIANNAINSNGYTYIYGIIISGDDFIIRSNNITTVSDYYANGIDIEGPASGVVEYNLIDVKANNSAYAIYSGMNGQNVSVVYTGNNIIGDAYNVFGMSLGDVESEIYDSTITLNCNYTTGIAYKGSKLIIDNCTISAMGSNVGNESIWESFGVETIGVKVVKGNATITNSSITSTGNYTIDVKDTASSVHDNFLVAAELFGNNSVAFTGNAEVYDNRPISATNVTISQVNEVVIDLPEDATGEVTVIVDGEKYASVPANKTLKIPLENLTNGNHEVEVKYSGDDKYAPKSSISTLFVSKPRIDTIITVDATFTRNATDYYALERGAYFYATLTDVNGNALVNKTVQIAINGRIYNETTDKDGRVGLQINLNAANTYTYALAFQGDDEYNAAPLASSKLTVVKKSTSISASSKSFKASAKTKKITVTLKTIKNKYDGKTYLKAGKKVTLKVNGVTYTGKIDSKGKVTFNIKLTKKGKYKAVIKFAGDKTYKASSKSVIITIK